MSVTVGGVADAQTPNNGAIISFSQDKNISSEDSGFHFFNEINSRAVRGFMKDHDDIYNVKWYKYKKGYVATFDKDSILTRLYYNKRGDFEVELRYFYENRLLPDIRNLVKSRYYDYSIFQVIEVSGYGKTFHQIKIRDRNYFKVINIINGEIEVVTKYIDFALK
jgi:hypothetical protein